MSFAQKYDNGNFLNGYCALAYRARDDESPSSTIESVILITARPFEGGLLIRVHPNWRRTARFEDHAELQALFDDLRERANLDPDGLFKQLSTLNVGPLRTYGTGHTLAGNPELLQLFEQFQDI